MILPAQSGSEFVWVRRQWNHYLRAKYPLAELSDVHWSTVSGGVQAHSPQPFLHAYVTCDAALEGELAHSGMHGECPHSIKVCIVKKDNTTEVFSRLADQAGPKPARNPTS